VNKHVLKSNTRFILDFNCLVNEVITVHQGLEKRLKASNHWLVDLHLPTLHLPFSLVPLVGHNYRSVRSLMTRNL
jgi:hypothetical protein